MMKTISWEDFEAIDIRTGRIIKAEPFPEARNPSYKIWADFGPDIGIKKTSAQITDCYNLEELPGKTILGVVNFPPKQIANFMSEFLLTGFYKTDGAVILAVPDKEIPLGTKLA